MKKNVKKLFSKWICENCEKMCPKIIWVKVYRENGGADWYCPYCNSRVSFASSVLHDDP